MGVKKKQPEQSPGQRLVAELEAELLEDGVQLDSRERTLLTTARQLVDRLDALEQIVARDGLMVTTEAGARLNPAAIEHRLCATMLPRVLAGIGAGDTTAGAGKSPVKQRAAAVRWANHNKQKALRGI
jgi:riboflavin biosynthesis pyrimidine reductase